MTRPPTLPRDVRAARDDLEDIAYKALRLAKELPDLHVLAYERQVTGDDPHVATSRIGYSLDDVGKAAARDALRAITGEHNAYGAAAIRKALTAHLARVQGFFGGEGADQSLRGTLLGDESGGGAQRELTELLKARERREASGQYTPARTEPQPKRVPGAGG